MSNPLMRAWQVKALTEPPSLALCDIERPTPLDDECLVRVEACGLAFGDTLLVRGRYQVKPQLPRAPKWWVPSLKPAQAGHLSVRVSPVRASRVRCEDLEPAESRTAYGAKAPDWLLSVSGKAGRRRQVPVPAELVDELGDELARHGFDRQVAAAGNQGIHVLARFDPELDRPAPWSASGLYQAIKAFLAQAASNLEGVDAQQLRKASTHWLRHCIPHPTMVSFQPTRPPHEELPEVYGT